MFWRGLCRSICTPLAPPRSRARPWIVGCGLALLGCMVEARSLGLCRASYLPTSWSRRHRKGLSATVLPGSASVRARERERTKKLGASIYLALGMSYAPLCALGAERCWCSIGEKTDATRPGPVGADAVPHVGTLCVDNGDVNGAQALSQICM